LSSDQTFRQWAQSRRCAKTSGPIRLETRQVVARSSKTVKLRNVVPPIHFESGVAKIPPDYVEKIARILESMRPPETSAIHFVGHTDSQRLSEPLARQFGDNVGLSRSAPAR